MQSTHRYLHLLRLVQSKNAAAAYCTAEHNTCRRVCTYLGTDEDGGAWQLYGNAHDWIISNQHMARTGG